MQEQKCCIFVNSWTVVRLGVSKMDNSGGEKQYFFSQRLAGQERGKTAETLVHLDTISIVEHF